MRSNLGEDTTGKAGEKRAIRDEWRQSKLKKRFLFIISAALEARN